jgi:hypothetical protein
MCVHMCTRAAHFIGCVALKKLILFDLIRLVCVKGSDAFLLESVFRNEVWGFMQLPVSKENEQLVLDTLVGYCEGALDGYETSDAEDAKAQSNGALPLRARMAAAAKLGEKKALRQSLQVFLDDLDTIDDKEYYQVWGPTQACVLLRVTTGADISLQHPSLYLFLLKLFASPFLF